VELYSGQGPWAPSASTKRHPTEAQRCPRPKPKPDASGNLHRRLRRVAAEVIVAWTKGAEKVALDDKWIKLAETRIGAKFPPALVFWFKSHNGGTINLGTECWWLHPCRDETDRRSIRKTADSLDRATNAAKNAPRFPPDGVVIGHNGAGDYLFVRAKDGYLGPELWLFRLRGGEETCVGDIADIFEHSGRVP